MKRSKTKFVIVRPQSSGGPSLRLFCVSFRLSPPRRLKRKICERCHRSLRVRAFCKNRKKSDGLNSWCRFCSSEYKRLYYQGNKTRILRKMKAEYRNNPEPIKARVLRYRQSHKAECVKRAVNYRRSHLSQVNARLRVWRRKRMRNIQFRLERNLRSRLNGVLRGSIKTGSAVRDLGCSILSLKSWLEHKFTSGMSWDNYGAVWQIDHVVPLSAFDLCDRSQLLKACHFTNLQPLSVADNVRKGGVRRRRD